ncbi:outer membrane immunogenic protein [Enhydrobacter aerosaccus]|uniref:Outer membrane immunogenic protein n=1 Tax=Enhydrobacter aerosaccus TaxID=225324 RepID=A0A1T4PQU8_9HYPH|nr:outer membrane beta-barrel protein [Enhydrobacter aerosaccus]SJZ93915.1 outer membrane immunogenic protein [Enhydrobacter aerosaccus]
MSFKKNTISIAAAVAAIIAAPLAAHAQTPAAPYWQGFYAGINLGGIWNNNATAITENGTTGGFSGTSGGILGGGQVGYNYMLGPVLVGPEFDFQGTSLSTNVSGGAGPSTISAQSTVPWFATFRARAGYPVGSVMPYVTGGAVWGHQTLSGYDTAGGGYFNASNNFWTWTAGGGVEGHITDRWSAKLEYLYIGTPSTPLSTPYTTSVSGSGVGNVIRVGLNYKLY